MKKKIKILIALIVGFALAMLLMSVAIYFGYTNAYSTDVNTLTVKILGIPIYELTKSGTEYIGKSIGVTNDDWAWFVGENREPIRLTTKPEPYTLQKALHWLQRQVAPTIKMVQALDRENHTTILKDMIEQAELKDKHKHLLQLEKSTIEERIDTAVPQENDGIF